MIRLIKNFFFGIKKENEDNDKNEISEIIENSSKSPNKGLSKNLKKNKTRSCEKININNFAPRNNSNISNINKNNAFEFQEKSEEFKIIGGKKSKCNNNSKKLDKEINKNIKNNKMSMKNINKFINIKNNDIDKNKISNKNINININNINNMNNHNINNNREFCLITNIDNNKNLKNKDIINNKEINIKNLENKNNKLKMRIINRCNSAANLKENNQTKKIQKEHPHIIFDEVSNLHPYHIKIFENINIFNSLLIMINSISYITDYFSKLNTLDKIKQCENNTKYCLTSIFYYINLYLWKSNEIPHISENKLKKRYIKFIDCYNNFICNNSNNDNFFIDLKNAAKIIDFIYEKINKELTQIYISNKNINPIKYRDKALSQFFNEFKQNNHSIISDNFMGIIQKTIECEICKNNIFMNNINDGFTSYNKFSYIDFDLKKIANYYLNQNNKSFKNNNFFQNHSLNINLDICFHYNFHVNDKKYYKEYCNNCLSNTKQVIVKNIFILPKILTIILSNSDNYNFILQDQIDLKQYVKKSNDNSIYYLVCILCKIIYNGKFIIYFINRNNGLWYSYSDKRVDLIKRKENNAIPIILIYQIINSISFEYNNIERDDMNKVKINIKFNNNISQKELFFNQNMEIKNIKQRIFYYFGLENKDFTLLINGKKVKDEHILKDYLSDNYNNNALVLLKE